MPAIMIVAMIIIVIHVVIMLHMAMMAIMLVGTGGDALDGDFHLDRACLLKGQGHGEALALDQRLGQAHQHDVQTARLQCHIAIGRDRNAALDLTYGMSSGAASKEYTSQFVALA